MRPAPLLALLLLPGIVRAAPVSRYAQHYQNELRRGPGAYYGVVYVISRGAPLTVLKSAGGWSQVEVAGLKAPGALWIADNCLGDAPPKSVLDWFRPQKPARMYAATAAVRGFALKLGRAKPAAVDGLLKRPEPFSAAQYAAFKAGSPAPRALLASELVPYDVTPQEEGIGLGVASKVAERGLVEDPRAGRYLNMLAASLAEASGAYQHPFRVYVVKGDEVNAVSAPGGWIFVTKPLLAACRSEAELAAVLAHEMTHVIRRHGLKELAARATNVRQDEAMAELDQMSGGSPDADAEADLDDIASEAFDAVHKPRLQKYEEEADRGAAALLARAGYDPAAVPRMIERVGAAVAAAPGAPDNPFSGMDYKKRRDAAELFLRTSLRGVSGASNEARLKASL